MQRWISSAAGRLGWGLFILLAACQAPPTASPTAVPTTLPPQVTIASPGTPSPTAVPTRPPLGPTPVSPTAATPSAIGPTGFPEDVNPLTGLAVADPTRLARRPLAIKVANSPRSIREKQSGLSLADLVFEHIAEGGNTRFTAVYLGQDVAAVGPIRSARLIDLELAAMYKAVFAFSGASAGTRQKILYSDIVNRAFSESGAGPGAWMFRADPDNWNLLEANTAELTRLSLERGVSGERQNLDGLKFDVTPGFGGEPATTVTVRFSAETWAEWRYDAASGQYLRWSDVSPEALEPLRDSLTNRQLSAANVAVLFVPTLPTDILEDDDGFDPATGAGGHYGVQIQLWNVGPAVVFRDGLAYRATWVRIGRDGTLGLVDADNRHIALKPGNRWIELVGASSDHSSAAGAWMFNHKAP